MLNLLLDFIFPKTCAGCGRTGTFFCSICTGNITQGELICPFCAKPSLGGATHPVCRRKFGLDGLWSLGLYKKPLRPAVQKLKYRFLTGLADDLNSILIEYWARRTPFILEKIIRSAGKDWLVVPVPLHWKRRNWRGFNQSALISKRFALRLGLNYSEALIRTKDTRPQVTLLATDRKNNIRNAFSLSPDAVPLKGLNILLIDDVWTTGSTMKECCYVLKKSGAKQVWALTLAR